MSNKIVDITGLDRFLTNIKAYFEELFSTKQDVIEDLNNIRDNAAKGATALQEHQDISGKLDKSEAETTYAAKNDLNDLSLEVQTNERVTASVISDIYDKLENGIGSGGSVDTSNFVTSVKINGQSKSPSNGVVDLGTVITAHQTLKTINGESILGDGNISIEAGNSDANVQAIDTGDVLDDVTVDYATTAYVDGLIGDINSVLENIING